MGELVAATAIVLAGGASSRFGADKLAADLGGEPLLHYAIRAAAAVCEEVLVVGHPDGLSVDLPQASPRAARIVLDAEFHPGPLVALLHGATEATRARVLIVGGDMPDLVTAILRRLLTWSAGREGACLIADGWPRPLPLGLDRDAVRDTAADLIASGKRSLRAIIGQLDMEHVPEAEWRELDPDGRSLRDIDRPGDLQLENPDPQANPGRGAAS